MLNLILVLPGCKYHHVGFPMMGPQLLYWCTYNIEPKSGPNITKMRKEILFMRPHTHCIAISVKFLTLSTQYNNVCYKTVGRVEAVFAFG